MKQTPQESFIAFMQSVRTLHLATITPEGRPNASYAPFVLGQKQVDEGNFYVFVSQLASHTQDLLANPEASILLAQDEANCRQIFARQRVSYQCSAERVDTSDKLYLTVLDEMEARFGNTISVLRNLPDFILFRLKPYKGSYVQGFGKAYELTGDGFLELVHINPVNEQE